MNLNREQFQIPKEHHDAIRQAIEYHGSQGVTFSPTSTDYRDETGKVHRVPVDHNFGRYLAVPTNDIKGSTYTHTLPSESIHEPHVNTFNGHSSIDNGVGFVKGPHGVKHSEPGFAGKLRSKQFKELDKSDKEAAERNSQGKGHWRTYMNEMEANQRVLGNRSHIVNVSVLTEGKYGDYGDYSEYEYDTKTGNIGPIPAYDQTAWENAADNPSVNRSEESSFGKPGKHLRSFERD